MITLPSIQYLLALLSFLFGILFVSRILRERRHPGTTLAWLLLILLLPYVGIPLYLAFGGRKVRRIAAEKETLYRPVNFTDTPTTEDTLERILLSTGVPKKEGGNRITLLTSGTDAYRNVVQIIRGAEESIHLTTYILGSDAVGESIVHELCAKAREGVQIRVLLDGFGCLWIKRSFIKRLRSAGAKIAIFMPIVRMPFTGNSNLRNHRKLLIADGVRGQVGGRNLAEEYMGPIGNPKGWCDLSLFIEGPAIGVLDDIFRSDWKYAAREDLPQAARSPEGQGEDVAQIVASGPDILNDAYYDAIISAAFRAKERFWVVTPYLILDETLTRALELASRRGVQVRIIVPRRSNHIIADLGRGAYLRQLSKVGAQVFYYEPAMLHAKAIVIDEQCAIVGTANMDMRSLLLNYEVSIFLYSKLSVEAVSRWMQSLLLKCGQEELKPNILVETLENFVRVFAPLL